MKIETYSQARLAYVAGVAKEDGTRYFPTLGELAEQYNISLSSISHVAGRERWSEQRENFQRRVYEQAVARYEDEFSRVLARADLDAAIAAADLVHHIRRQIEHATEQERTSLAKVIAKPLRELLGVVHEAVGVQQIIEQTGEVHSHEIHTEAA